MISIRIYLRVKEIQLFLRDCNPVLMNVVFSKVCLFFCNEALLCKTLSTLHSYNSYIYSWQVCRQ